MAIAHMTRSGELKPNIKISYSRVLAKNESQDFLFKIISKKINLKISCSRLLAKNEYQDFLFKD
jgi:hypothetical protein